MCAVVLKIPLSLDHAFCYVRVGRPLPHQGRISCGFCSMSAHPDNLCSTKLMSAISAELRPLRGFPVPPSWVMRVHTAINHVYVLRSASADPNSNP